ADRVAKACSLLPWNDKTQQEELLALARKAVQLESLRVDDRGFKGSRNLPWYQVALGMAEYRSGHFAEADAALLAAAKRAPSAGASRQTATTGAWPPAMSLSRKGKENEARQLTLETVSWMKPLPTDQKTPLAAKLGNPGLIYDLIPWLAYKEAKALIQFDA